MNSSNIRFCFQLVKKLLNMDSVVHDKFKCGFQIWNGSHYCFRSIILNNFFKVVFFIFLVEYNTNLNGYYKVLFINKFYRINILKPKIKLQLLNKKSKIAWIYIYIYIYIYIKYEVFSNPICNLIIVRCLHLPCPQFSRVIS